MERNGTLWNVALKLATCVTSQAGVRVTLNVTVKGGCVLVALGVEGEVWAEMMLCFSQVYFCLYL